MAAQPGRRRPGRLRDPPSRRRSPRQGRGPLDDRHVAGGGGVVVRDGRVPERTGRACVPGRGPVVHRRTRDALAGAVVEPAHLPAVTGPGGELRADARRNRQLILQAARRCFAERGTTVPLADIARAAGVGVATVHRHFGGRPGILNEVATAQARDLTTVSTRAAREADPGTALCALLLGLFELRESDRTITDAMTRCSPTCSDVDLDRFDADVHLVIDRARAAGLVSDDFDRRDVLSLTIMVGAVADGLHTTDSDAPQRASTLLLRGVFG
ncbi:hypothetical protein DEI95_02105 [Curtobacterium sp. MCBD17_008]|nr:hypothetical protein DEI95_02105 [Curtobacterium sp. MCBD17_008]